MFVKKHYSLLLVLLIAGIIRQLAPFLNFQSATLESGKMLDDKSKDVDSSDDDDGEEEDESKFKAKTFAMTDEELFKACGGMTAHKYARKP